MKPLRFIGILLQPSVVSVVCSFALSLVILFVATLQVTQPNGTLYNFLIGSESSDTPELIMLIRDNLMVVDEVFFGNETLNKVLFFICWLFLGTVVYLISSSISNSVVAANDIRSELHYLNLHKKELEEEVGKRLALRGAILLIWLLYVIFFFKYLLPYAAIAARVSISSLASSQGLLYGSLSLVLLMLSLHIHVVLLRAALLRPRAFGGWEAVLQEEQYKG